MVEIVTKDGSFLLEGRGPWTVGRSQENDIVIPDPNVSRKHARLSRADNGYVVEDLGSTNGTLLDGAPIDRERIESGDELTFGQSTARFVRRIDSPREGERTLRAPGGVKAVLDLQVPLLAAKALLLLLLFAFIYAVMRRGIGDLRRVSRRRALRARTGAGRARRLRATRLGPRLRTRRRGLRRSWPPRPGSRSTTARPASAAPRRATSSSRATTTPRGATPSSPATEGSFTWRTWVDQRYVRQRAQDRRRNSLEARGQRAGRLDNLQVRRVVSRAMLFLEPFGATDAGKVRANNEDALLVGEGRDETLFAVADGIGGFEPGRWRAASP